MKFSHSLTLKSILLFVFGLLCCIQTNAQSIKGPNDACVGDPVFFTVDTYTAKDTLQWWISSNGSSWEKYKLTANKSLTVNEMPSHDLYVSVTKMGVNHSSSSPSKRVRLQTEHCNSTVCRQTSTGEFFFGSDCDPKNGQTGIVFHGSNNSNNIVEYFPDDVTIYSRDNFEGIIYNGKQLKSQGFFSDSVPGGEANYFFKFDPKENNIRPFELQFKSYQGKSFSILMRYYVEWTCGNHSDGTPHNSDPIDIKLEGTYGSQVANQCLNINIKEVGGEFQTYTKCESNQPEIRIPGGRFTKGKLYVVDVIFDGVFTTDQANNTLQPRLNINGENCYHIAMDFISFENQQVCVTPRSVCAGNTILVNTAGFKYNTAFIWKKESSPGSNNFVEIPSSEVSYEDKNRKQANILIKNPGEYKYRVVDASNSKFYVDFTLIGEDCENILGPQITGEGKLCKDKTALEQSYTLKETESLTWLTGTVSYKWKLLDPTNADVSSYLSYSNGKKTAKITFPAAAKISDDYNGKPYRLIMVPTENDIEIEEYPDTFEIILHRVPDLSGLTPYAEDICPSNPGKDTVAFLGFHNLGLDKMGYTYTWRSAQKLPGDSAATLSINHSSYCSLTADRSQTFTMTANNDGCESKINGKINILAMKDPKEEGGPASTKSTVECENQAVEPTLPVVKDFCGNIIPAPAPTITRNITNGNGTIKYTYIYKDCGDRSFTWVYTYTVKRTQGPKEEGTAVQRESQVSCESEATEPTKLPIVVDACGNTLKNPSIEVGGNFDGCSGTKTYTYTYTDEAGLTFVWTYTYHISTPATPALKVANSWPADQINVNGCYSEIPAFPSDNDIKALFAAACGKSLTVTSVETAGTRSNDCDWSKTLKYTITDGCTSVDKTITYSGGDKTAPKMKTTMAWPANVGNMNICFPTSDYPELRSDLQIKSMFDDCGEISVSHNDINNKTSDCDWSITRKYVIEDACHNKVDSSMTISGGDVSAPTYTGTIKSITQDGCDKNDLPAAATTIAALESATGLTFSDNCTNHSELKVTHSDSELSGSCAKTMTRTYTVTDKCNKSVSVEQTITLTVANAIVITGTDHSTVSCPADAIAPHEAGIMPTVKDACGKDISANYTLKSSPTTSPCNGTMKYVYTFTDCANNTKDWTYTYTVDLPSLKITNGTATAVCAIDAKKPTAPTLKDACGRDVVPVYVDSTASIDIHGNGTVTHRFTYTDCEGTDYTWKYIYTVTAATFQPIADGEKDIYCATEATTPSTPNVTICGTPITFTAKGKTDNATTTGCGDIAYVYTYTVNGNDYEWRYTYHVSPEPFTIPTIKTTETVECVAEAVAPTTPTVTNSCGKTITPTLKSGYPTSLSGNAEEGQIIYIYNYTDCAGYSKDWTFTYTIKRTTKPTETGTPVATSKTVECESEATAPTQLPVVKDVCGKTLTAPDPIIGGTYADCEGTKTYTYIYKDYVDSTFTWTFTYNIKHSTNPSQVGTPVATSSTVECESEATAPTTLPVVKDVCGNTLTAPAPEISGTYTDCEGTKIYTYTYTDCAGLKYVWTYTYTIKRTTAPSESGTHVANSKTVNCLSEATAPTTLPVVKDVCGKTLEAPTPSVVDNYEKCEGTRTYNYLYKDCAGLTFTWSYVYTINHPDLTVPANDTVNIVCEKDTIRPTPANWTDKCGNSIPAVLNGSQVSTVDQTGNGFVTYNFIYEDCTGKTYPWQYVFKVSADTYTPKRNDTTSVHCFSEATQPTAPFVTICGERIDFNFTDKNDKTAEGCGFVDYNYSYTVNGTDYSWTYVYKVSPLDFTIAKDKDTAYIACKAELKEPTLPVVKDACGRTLTPVSGPEISAVPNCDGFVTYKYTYNDCTGNHPHDWTYYYKIETPDFTLPAAKGETIACRSQVVEPDPSLLPTVTDYCGNQLTPSAPIRSDIPDCEGQVTYTYTYTDCAGHSHDWIYTYTIKKEAPVIASTGVQNTQNISCINDTIAPATVPTATNSCGEAVAPTYVKTEDWTAGKENCQGTITYTYTYTDCGLSSTWDFVYVLNDNIAPVFDCPSDSSFKVHTSCDTIITINAPQVTDNCKTGSLYYTIGDGTETLYTAPFQNKFELGKTTITWRAIDACGNIATCDHDYTISDSTGITISCPTENSAIIDTCIDLTWAEVKSLLKPTQIATAKRIDCKNNIDEEIQPELSYRMISGPTVPVMGIGFLPNFTELTDESILEYDATYEIKWLFIKSGDDMETMKDSCFSTVLLQDTSVPTVDCSAMVNITLAPVNSCDTLYTLLKPEGVFNDNCGEDGLLYLYKIGNGRFTPFEENNSIVDLLYGDTIITWRVRDQYSQSESCEQHITVVDNVIPTTTCPNDTAINVLADCQIDVMLTPATAFDHCGIDSIQYSTNNVTFNNFTGTTLDTTLIVGNHTIYWRSVDVHGLRSQVCSTNVTIFDTIVPTITCPADIEVAIDNGCETDVKFTPATANDNCQVEGIYYSFDNITFDKVTDADIVKNYPVSKNNVYWFSKDIHGNNSDTCIQTVTILDNRKFDIDCPEWNNSESFIIETCDDLTWKELKDSLDKLNMSASASYTDCNTNTVTVIDSVNMEYTEKGVDNWAPMLNDTKLYYNKDYTIRWIFTKAGENLVTLKDSCELPILLKDTTKPVFDCANIDPDSVVQVLEGVCEIEFEKIVFNNYEATDNCDGKVKGVLSWSENIADTVTATTKFEVGKVYELKWIFRDKTGNQITCDQKLMLNSDIEPIFDCDSLKNTPIDTVLHDACEISAADLNINIPFALDACTADTIWGQPTRRSGEPFDGIYKVGRDTIDWIFVSIYSTDTANCEQYIYIKSDKKLDFDCDSLNEAVIDTVLHGVCEITAEGLNVPTPFAIDVCTLDTIWGVGTRRSLAAMTDDYKVGRDTIDWTFISEYSTDTVICWQPIFIQSDIKPVFNCDSLNEATIDTVLHGVCEISAADLKLVTPFAIDYCTKDTVWGIGTRRSGEPVDGIYKVGRDTIDWKFISEFSTDTTYCEQFVFIQNDDMPTVDCDSLENNPIHVVLHDTCVISASDLNVNTPFALTCFNDTIWGVGVRTSGKAMTDNYEVGRDTIIWTFQNENTTTPAVCKQFVFIQSDKKPEVDCDTILPIHQVLNGVCSIDSATFNLQTPYALDACTRDTLWGLGRRTSGKTLGDDYTVGRDTIIWKFVSEYSTDTAYCEQPIFIQSDIEPIFDCDSLKNAPIDTVLHDVCEISAADLNINIPFAIDSCTRDTIYGQPTRRSGEAFDGIYKVGRDTIDWIFVSEYSIDTARCEQYIYIKSDKKLDFDCDSLNEAVIDTVLHGVCEITAEGLNVPTPFAIDVCTLDTIWGVGTRRSLAAMTDDYKVGRDTIDWTFISEYSTDTVICWQPVFIQSDIEPVFDCKNIHDTTLYLGLDQCEIPEGTVSLPTPIAKDACTDTDIPGVPTRLDGKAMTDAYPRDTTMITWKFTSIFSTAEKECPQNVIVVDTFPPMPDCEALDTIIVQIAENSTYFDSATYQEAVDAGLKIPSYKDVCDGEIIAVGEREDHKPLESVFPLGETIIHWIYTDKSGNSNSCSQVVTVTDWIIDTLYCPGDLDGKVFACVDDIPAPYKTFDEFKRAGGSFSNEKKMDPSTFYYNDSITNDSCNMVVTRSYHVIDLKKNDISCEEVIYVKDTVAPTFDIAIIDTVLSCADTIFSGSHITATDNCDPNPQVTIAETSTRSDDPTQCEFYSYDITRTYTAKDRCGNETAATQMIHVRDTIAPSLSLPENWDKYILATFKKKCLFDVPDLTEEVRGYAHDNCTSDENLKVVQVPSPGTQIKQSTDLKIYIYDVCGNVDSTKKFIKVQDGATIAHLTAHDVDSCVTEDRGVSLANENIRHASGQMEIIDDWDGTIMKIASTFVYEYYRGKEAKPENIMFSNNENTQWDVFQELINIYGSTDKAATELTKISQRSESGYYTMVAIDTTSGCTDTATIYVNILERPKVVLESAKISVCEGNMVDIAPYVSCIDSMGADSVWTYWMKGDKKFDFEDSIAGLLSYEDNENTAVFYAENRCGSTSSLNSHLAFCVDPAHPMTTKDTLDYLNNDSTALEMLRANGLYSRDSITFDVHKRFKAEDIVIRTNPSNPARIWRGESIELSAYSKYPYEQLIWYKVVGEYDRANYNDATEHEEFEFNNMDDEKDSLITILLTNESSTIIEYPNDTTDYYVTVSDGVCPSASSDLTKVLVLDAIPTAFTPYDKEGLNDIFMERHHVVIYDRYGQKAFEGNNGWDGTHKGRMADPGVYYYQVLMGDGSLRTGSIEIINLK